MTKEELEKLRLQMPPLATDMLFREKPTCVKDEHGFYSTGCFLWKGKKIIITIDEGLWHLSVSCNHTLGYYELKEIRYTFLPNNMFVAQVFPPREDFVNLHENCFHLWQLAPGGYAEIIKED